jgi:hypothetical protein
MDVKISPMTEQWATVFSMLIITIMLTALIFSSEQSRTFAEVMCKTAG